MRLGGFTDAGSICECPPLVSIEPNVTSPKSCVQKRTRQTQGFPVRTFHHFTFWTLYSVISPHGGHSAHRAHRAHRVHGAHTAHEAHRAHEAYRARGARRAARACGAHKAHDVDTGSPLRCEDTAAPQM